MSEINKEYFEAYHKLTASLILGLARLAQARICSNTLFILWAELQVYQSEHGGDDSDFDVPGYPDLTQVSKEEMDGFRYVSNITHLVYATTLFDTFLRDTTVFLYLVNPDSLGKEPAATIRQIRDAESTNELLTEIAKRRSRKIGGESFLARLRMLKKQFGLKFEIDTEAIELLKHYSDTRNAAVHDQGVYEPYLDDSGKVSVRQTACALHPTPVSDQELGVATKNIMNVVRVIYDSVVSQVLKHDGSNEFRGLLEVMHFGKTP